MLLRDARFDMNPHQLSATFKLQIQKDPRWAGLSVLRLVEPGGFEPPV